MKKTIITAGLLASMCVATFAQSTLQPTASQPSTAKMQPVQTKMQQPASVSPDDRAKRMADRINMVVQLTPEQYQKVLEVNKDFATKQEASRTSVQTSAPQTLQPGTPNPRIEAMKAMNDERDQKLKAILTPEQWQKWQGSRMQMQRVKATDTQTPAVETEKK